MYCRRCGKELNDEFKVCPYCGEPVDGFNINVNPQYNQPVINENNDRGGFGWALLGFFIPIVGLILYLVWKNDKPKSAKSAGKGALISVILSVVFYLIAIIISFSVAGMGGDPSNGEIYYSILNLL